MLKTLGRGWTNKNASIPGTPLINHNRKVKRGNQALCSLDVVQSQAETPRVKCEVPIYQWEISENKETVQ